MGSQGVRNVRNDRNIRNVRDDRDSNIRNESNFRNTNGRVFTRTRVELPRLRAEHVLATLDLVVVRW